MRVPTSVLRTSEWPWPNQFPSVCPTAEAGPRRATPLTISRRCSRAMPTGTECETLQTMPTWKRYSRSMILSFLQGNQPRSAQEFRTSRSVWIVTTQVTRHASLSFELTGLALTSAPGARWTSRPLNLAEAVFFLLSIRRACLRRGTSSQAVSGSLREALNDFAFPSDELEVEAGSRFEEHRLILVKRGCND
jgi:hypothetical protein